MKTNTSSFVLLMALSLSGCGGESKQDHGQAQPTETYSVPDVRIPTPRMPVVPVHAASAQPMVPAPSDPVVASDRVTNAESNPTREDSTEVEPDGRALPQ